ncbi:hypothetical protein O1611_g6837 [Lasiodiplodia mahajangana]|uniref:Uncharacterized protein n=1 Tax=Lasiodiplodia mahajangana TaxID=1108764 RepID=A0ACC2JH68_9PEZI|nr:hypothetical protein O1611_g6837 [Lasiodiplodia mahajangana]
MADIKAYLGSKVAENLQSYFDLLYPDVFSTPTALMTYLHNYYYDVNAFNKFKQTFKTFHIEDGPKKYLLDKFSEFKNEFVRLAEETKLAKAQWMDNFKNQLSVRLNTETTFEYLKTRATFDLYTKYCTQIAHILSTGDKKRATARKDKDKGKELVKS